jgi:hypothetical protein
MCTHVVCCVLLKTQASPFTSKNNCRIKFYFRAFLVGWTTAAAKNDSFNFAPKKKIFKKFTR